MLDLTYAPAIFLGLVFGGSLLRNGNMARSNLASRSYIRIRANPLNATLSSIVLDSAGGKQAATRGSNPHDCRRLSLKEEYGMRSRAPRKAFIERAGRLYDDHAPLGFEITREQYLAALTGWFAKADKRYETYAAAQRGFVVHRGVDDKGNAHPTTATT